MYANGDHGLGECTSVRVQVFSVHCSSVWSRSVCINSFIFFLYVSCHIILSFFFLIRLIFAAVSYYILSLPDSQIFHPIEHSISASNRINNSNKTTAEKNQQPANDQFRYINATVLLKSLSYLCITSESIVRSFDPSIKWSFVRNSRKLRKKKQHITEKWAPIPLISQVEWMANRKKQQKKL